MILVFTGDGKGKTTSAIGQGIRVLGQGQKVFMAQFIKSKKWPTGEEKILKEIKDFTLIKGGKGFVGILGDNLPFALHKKAAIDTLSKAKKALISGKFRLIILDEANVALSLKLLSRKEILDFLKYLPTKNIDAIFTGRGAPDWLLKKADLVTNFGEVKHYFKEGVIGRKAREY